MRKSPKRKNGDPRRPSFKRGEIDAHHRRLELDFSALLAEKVRVDEPQDWWNRADRATVAFDLIGTDSGKSQRAERKGRGWHQVVAVRHREAWWGECRAWISWYEEWISVRGMTFELRSVGLTVFWGPAQDKRQLIRAEWAEPPSHGGAAAQPHWHADFEEFVDPAFADETALAEIDDQRYEHPSPSQSALFGISLSGCHLAMGGWERTDIDDNPWQACVGTDLSRLTTWATTTLTYVITQLAKCRRADAVS